MEIQIYTDNRGKPKVRVFGSSQNSAKQVIKAYREAVAELSKKEVKV